MFFRAKGLFFSPFVLLIFFSCVSAPEKPNPPSGGGSEKPASEKPSTEDSLSFYKGPQDAEKAIKILEEKDNESMDRDSRFIYYSLLVSDNDMDKAREQMDILLRENPDDIEILEAAVKLMDYQGDEKKRDSTLAHLESLDGENSFAYNMEGVLAMRKKDYGRAESFFQKSLAVGGDNSESLIGLANSMMHESGKEKESIDVFNRAEKIDPSNPFIYSDRARVYRFLKDYGKAEDDLTRAISLNPSEWNYLDRARIRLGDLGDREGGRKDVEKVLQLDKDNFFANVYMAGICDDNREYDKAIAYYEKVLSIADDYKYAYPALGKLYFIKDRWSDAAEMYRKASQAGLNEMTYPLMAYLAYAKTGDLKKGEDLLNANIGKLDRSSSIYEMYRYYLNPSSAYFIQLAIDNEKNDLMRDRMKYYLAMIDELNNRPDTAKAIFGEIADRKGAYEFELASIEMEKE